MAILAIPQLITLNAGTPRIQTTFTPVAPLTDAVTLRLRLPTTAAPLAWTSTGICRVTLIVAVDGVEHRTIGQVRGGVHSGPSGEAAEYQLVYRPTVFDPGGAFTIVDGQRVRTARRLGEGRATVEARVILERMAGTINTEILAAVTTEAAPPVIRVHNSVAFDAVTSAQELSGDNVLSLTHTSSGSLRGVFAGVGLYDGAQNANSVSCSYAGSGMTEVWDVTNGTFIGCAGYALAAQATGAQTVTSTTGMDNAAQHGLIVISMTGVDQTTPVGTPATAFGAATTASVTVGSVAAGDMVVDTIQSQSPSDPTPGADQTQRDLENFGGGGRVVASTQFGTAGGVMSWVYGSVDFWTLGAVAFKADAGGGGTDGWKILIH